MDIRQTRFLILIWICAIILSFPFKLYADIYKYVDKAGTTHFVDDLSKIPQEYRNQVTVSEEKPEGETEEATSPAVETKGETPEEARTRRMLEDLEEKKRQDEEKAREEYEKSLVTKVTIKGNQVLVPVTLGYGGREVQASLVFDTGAEMTVIHQAVADRLNLLLTKRTSVRFGPYEAKGVPVWVVFPQGPPTGEDGALGMNFLRGLEYSVDFENQVIRWKAK
jgi:hypothetical protein